MARQPGEQYDYIRVGSVVDAFMIAKRLGYDKRLVHLVQASDLAKVSEDRIEEIDGSWIVASSPLLTKPIRTIAFGVVLGMAIWTAVLLLIAAVSGGDVTLG